ncbi:hypothetical protein ACIQD5_12905 [Streptomyces microflavus]|uniref:hypothetical protein n=1 Tax=Streptomyces microflavus TaxID=1919 RepID=UPI003809D2B8
MCDPALRLYEKALHAGRIARTDLTDAPLPSRTGLAPSRPINEATATARDEVLTAQPGSDRPAGKLQEALANAHTAIRRGARIRHIYQHPARYSGSIRDCLSQVPAQHLRVRTTELTVERLVIIDRSVAYTPASADRSTALRISHPALVSYLIQVYEVLWAQAVPLAENHQATAPNAPASPAPAPARTNPRRKPPGIAPPPRRGAASGGRGPPSSPSTAAVGRKPGNPRPGHTRRGRESV